MPFALWVLVAAAPAGGQAGDLSARVLALTGARTKVVWVHAVRGGGSNWDATGDDYELKGFDTAEGSPRTILPGPASFANPCLSPDGRLVLFTDLPAGTIYSVGWDGRQRRSVANGYALCTWRDPSDSSAWVYFTPGGYMKGDLTRCRLDDPNVRQVVWSKDQAAHTLTVSADGLRAGSEFPWPYAGVAVLPNVSWRQYGNGCNACLAPDNSYRFFHMGEQASHNGVMMYDDGGFNKRVVELNPAGDANRRLDCWVPRWSNDVRFLTVTSPIAREQADVYLGRFDDDFTRVRPWVRISSQTGQDTKACAWIEPGLGQHSGEAPYSVELTPAAPGDGPWRWDFGDSATAEAPTGRHTYAQPGGFDVTARRGPTVLRGWVNVRPRLEPAVTDARLLDERRLQVTFDERVRARGAAVRLASGVPVRSFALDAEGFRLMIELGGKLPAADTLNLQGLFDLAQVPNAVTAAVPISRPAWPSRRDGLVFLWSTANDRGFQYDPRAEAFIQSRLTSQGMARMDVDGAMALRGGLMSAVDGGAGMAAECGRSGEFTIEAAIWPDNVHQGHGADPRRIVSCQSGPSLDSVNLALAQEGDQLVLYVRTTLPARGARPEIQRLVLCRLAPREPNLIAVSCAPGRLACYRNGQLVNASDRVKGSLSWRRPPFADGLCFGGSQRSQFPWRGRLEHLAVFCRAIDADQAKADFAAAGRAILGRKPPAQLAILGKLLAKSEVPQPKEIAPYVNALVINEYAVDRLLGGSYAAKRIRVAQWGLVDKQPTEQTAARIGEQTLLVLERLSDRPDLAAEARRDTLPEELDLDSYVDVTIRPAGEPRLTTVAVHPGELWLPTGGQVRFVAERLDQYGNPIDAAIRWSAVGGGELDMGTAYGAAQHFDAHRLAGGGTVDAGGLFRGEKAGVVTVTAAGVDDASVKSAAVIGVGEYPVIHPAERAALRIGVDNSDDHPYTGDIDRVRIYRRVLTDAEIADHAAGRGLDAKDPALVADWTFDEPAGGAFANQAGEGLAARIVDEVRHVRDRTGGYVRLAGKGHLEVAPEKRLDIERSCTLEAWVRPAKEGCVLSRQMVWMWGFYLGVLDKGVVLDALRTNTRPLSAACEFAPGAWTHVVGVLDVAGAWRLYANGKQVAKYDRRPLVLRD